MDCLDALSLKIELCGKNLHFTVQQEKEVIRVDFDLSFVRKNLSSSEFRRYNRLVRRYNHGILRGKKRRNRLKVLSKKLIDKLAEQEQEVSETVPLVNGVEQEEQVSLEETIAPEVSEEEKSTEMVQEEGEEKAPVEEVSEEEKSTEMVQEEGEEKAPVEEVSEEEKSTEMVQEKGEEKAPVEETSEEL